VLHRKVVALHQIEIKQKYPQEGWVEQDPKEILQAVIACIEETVKKTVRWDRSRNSRHTLSKTFHATLHVATLSQRMRVETVCDLRVPSCISLVGLKISYVTPHPANVPWIALLQITLQRVTERMRDIEKYSHVNEWRKLRSI